MKYLILSFFLLMFVSSANAQFAGGEGTESDPYQIVDVDQLQEMQNYLEQHFVLIADIDASETAGWNDGEGFVSIGNGDVSFTGSFDGAGHVIENLTINRPEDREMGLFGRTEGSVIMNVGLEHVSISSGEYTGALIGRNHGSQVSYVYSTGEISGDDRVGGLLGDNRDEGQVENSWSTADVSGDRRIGGIAGYNRDGSSISTSFATGAISGNRDVGGLVGQNPEPSITSTYWNVETSGQTEAVGSGVAAGTAGLTTDEMTGIAAHENMTGFDFEESWKLTEHYPALYWQDVEELPLPSERVDLFAPENEAADVSLTPTFQWYPFEWATEYTIQVSTDDDFSDLVIDIEVSDNFLVVDDDLEFETTYFWRVMASGDEQQSDWSETWTFTTVVPTSSDLVAVPEEFELQQNYPNPFNLSTEIRFVLPESAHVRLEIYNLTGQRLATLVNEQFEAGYHDISFDADNFASGVYLYRIHAGEFVQTRKMMLVK